MRDYSLCPVHIPWFQGFNLKLFKFTRQCLRWLMMANCWTWKSIKQNVGFGCSLGACSFSINRDALQCAMTQSLSKRYWWGQAKWDLGENRTPPTLRFQLGRFFKWDWPIKRTDNEKRVRVSCFRPQDQTNHWVYFGLTLCTSLGPSLWPAARQKTTVFSTFAAEKQLNFQCQIWPLIYVLFGGEC